MTTQTTRVRPMPSAPIQSPPGLMPRLARIEELAYRFGAWRKRPPLRIVVFAQGRSGTTLMTDLLDCHPKIQCTGEILGYPRWDPVGYVENHAKISGSYGFGFHVKIQHLTRLNGFADPGVFLRHMHAEGWHIIYLWRRNLASGAVSSIFAETAQYYHTRGSKKRPELPPMTPDPKNFVDRMRWRRDKLEGERAALEGLPFQEVVYEDDILPMDTRQATLDRLFTSFGLEPAPVTTSLVKSVKGDFWDKLGNADEIKDAVRAAGMAKEAGLSER